MGGVTIIGSGYFVPGEPIPNEALARVMDTNDAWIQQRTGIEQRHLANEGQGVSDLACEASTRAIQDAGIDPNEIDFIVFATMTPEYMFPGSGGLLGAKLGITGVPALDIRQQCATIPYALQIANALIASGAAKTILIAGADAHAGFMPWSDWDVVRGKSDRQVDPADYERATRHRGIAVIFGDGASAWVVRKSKAENSGFIGAELHTNGELFKHIYVPKGGFTQLPYIDQSVLDNDTYIPTMQGQGLFKSAVTKLSSVVKSVCATHDLSIDDIDCFIAHQANDRINQAVRKSLKIPAEKVPSNIARYGNTSSATIGILTDELRQDGRIKQGDLLCFFALGAGLNWGAALMRL